MSDRLIDDFAREPDVSSAHSIHIAASPESVWRALWRIDLSRLRMARLLVGLRGLPKLLAGRSTLARRSTRPILEEIQSAGFGKLGEHPGSEVVFGVHGRFWRPADNIDPFDRKAFDAPTPAGRARAVMSFELDRIDAEATRLLTETRVTCGDDASRRRFRAYWFFVRPFSGWIRVLLLREIRRRAERSAE